MCASVGADFVKDIFLHKTQNAHTLRLMETLKTFYKLQLRNLFCHHFDDALNNTKNSFQNYRKLV
jgi:hypothetical protein